MNTDEWFKKADHGMETAEFMFKGERYFYASCPTYPSKKPESAVSKSSSSLYEENYVFK